MLEICIRLSGVVNEINAHTFNSRIIESAPATCFVFFIQINTYIDLEFPVV